MSGTFVTEAARDEKQPGRWRKVEQRLAAAAGFIARQKDFAATVQSVATICALIVGGFWTYRAFVEQRQDKPKLKVEHRIDDYRVTRDKNLLIVDVVISNVGSIVVPLTTETIDIYQLKPLREDQISGLSKGVDYFAKDPIEMTLGTVVPRQKTDWKQRHARLEPGEVEQIHHEFLVSASVKAVRVYSYFKNLAAEDNAGWDWTTTYRLHDGRP